MKNKRLKRILLSSTPIFIAVLIFVTPSVTYASSDVVSGLLGILVGKPFTLASAVADILIIPLSGLVGFVLLPLANLITYFGGTVLNYAVVNTVVHMSSYAMFAKGGAIDQTWTTIRDIANMGFIFVLLYASIQLILGNKSTTDTRKLIVNMIIAAVLINFSLFFTKLIIDAANVMAVFVYDAIAPGATSDMNSGLAGALMDHLGVSALWKNTSLPELVTGKNSSRLLIAGIMSIVINLTAGFAFLAMALMFVIRFVVLVFVLILSPIMFISSILPDFGKYRTQWWNALMGQAFFAPIFFLMIWIVDMIAQSLPPVDPDKAINGVAAAGGGVTASLNDTGTFIMSYAIIMVGIIASIIIAKNYSDKAGGVVKKLTGRALGFAGATTLGTAARFGRGSLGRMGAGIATSSRVKNMVDKGGVQGALGRLAMASGNKAAKSSWDIRSTELNKQLNAGKAKKGGFMADQKSRQESAAQMAKSLEVSADERKRLQNIEDEALRRAGYAKPAALTEAEANLEREKERREGESDKEYNRRQRIAKARLQAEKTKDYPDREKYAADHKEVEKAMAANKQANERPKHFAGKQEEPILTIPEWATKRNEAIAKFNEKVLKPGIGGVSGEKLRSIGTEQLVKGNRRLGGFLDAVGRGLSLRQAERKDIADKARKYDETLKKKKDEEISEKLKKATEDKEETEEKEEKKEAGGGGGGGGEAKKEEQKQ